MYASVCSGIEAASVAWKMLGWECAFVSEIDKFPSALLAHHYPDVPNYGDMTRFKEWPDAAFDLLVGGTPCQSFSVAGLRKGLDDPRGNLMLTYLAIARRYRPAWLVWENVPGVLSVDGGRAFGTFLGGLAELGYGFAYRVLDAQYVRVDGLERAVPQRRRRVFVVGHFGDWRRAAAVLFERESLSGNPAPRREAGQGATYDAAPCLAASGRGFERAGDTRGQDCLIASTGNVAHCLNAGAMGQIDYETETMVAEVAGTMKATAESGGWSNSADHAAGGYMVAFSSKDHGADAGETSPTLRAMGHDGSHANAGGQVAVAFDMRGREGGAQFEGPHDTANIRAASGGSSKSYVQQSWAVRRLTPVECERLQGFPDNYTAIPYRGKPAADGPRYKALGNSMAVNCMRWIGTRIGDLDAQLDAQAA